LRQFRLTHEAALNDAMFGHGPEYAQGRARSPEQNEIIFRREKNRQKL
jgi:hypothetical protein